MAVGLFVVLLVISAVCGPHLFTLDGAAGAIIVVVPLVLAAMALTPIALVGRGSVDLAIGPLIGFLNVTLVQVLIANDVTSPVAVIAWVIAVGVAYQLLQGAIIVFVRVAPIIVTLSGYLVLSGVNLVIMPKPSGSVPDWMSDWGSGTTVFTPVLLVLVIGLVAWLLFTRTAFYQHLRLTGADERMAYASGVQTNLVRLGAHAIGGFFAGLAALAYPVGVVLPLLEAGMAQSAGGTVCGLVSVASARCSASPSTAANARSSWYRVAAPKSSDCTAFRSAFKLSKSWLTYC